MPITTDSTKVYLTHPSGSSAEIYLYGATVTSWKAGGEERLFVSGKAVLDGSKAIRGGIPVVFPIFGPPPTDKTAFPHHSQLPQHGFARTSIWSVANQSEDKEATVVELVLNPTDEIKKTFPIPFGLTYTLTLTEKTFTAQLKVTNPSSSDALKFQSLLHTYLSVPSHLDALVSPLKSLSYKDKTRGGNSFTEDREKVDVKEETDRVYEKVGPKGKLTLEYGQGKGGVEVGVEGFEDATIWNPGQKTGSGMGDMEDKGWEKFVCVEPGYVSKFYELPAGQEWVGEMVLKVFD